MVRIGIIASRFGEAGTIDQARLVRHIQRLKDRGGSVDCKFDPTQWELERSLADGDVDLYLPLTMHSFESCDGETRRREYVIQATLERHNARFVGSSGLVQLLVRDKAVVTRQSGIGFETKVLSRHRIEHGLEPNWYGEFAAPRVIVKPNDMTSSIGIDADCVVELEDAADRALRLLREHPLVENVLIQPYFEQAREFTVSVLGNVPRPYSSVLELRSRHPAGRHELFTRNGKLIRPEDRDVQFVECDDPDMRHALIFHSVRLFDWFNMKDYARFDYIYTDKPHLIDVNAMPVLGRSFGLELARRFEIDLDDLPTLVLSVAARRYTASGRPTPVPESLLNGISRITDEIAGAALPVDAVPESTIPSPFQPLTQKFTMVDRVGAETDVLFFLKALVHLIKPRFVLETGTYRGATAAAIGEALRATGAGRMVTLECDPHYAANSRINLAGLPVEVVTASSLEYVPDGPIDLLFLDSTRPARVHEFRRFKHLLSSEALIVWHDSAPEHSVVHRDIEDLVSAGDLHAILLPSPRGLTISKVRKPGRL
jgi:predicted O-methyltransferase YrrM/D-alanine-D-alanine ligase-like ATP-grasp enzyme